MKQVSWVGGLLAFLTLWVSLSALFNIGFCALEDLSPEEAILISLVSEDEINSTQYHLTSQPHLAGTYQDYDTANYTRSLLESYGWNATIETLTVLLSYPVSRRVSIVSPENKTFTATMVENPFPQDPTSYSNDTVPTFNGYSPSGNVTAEVVYANFGTVSDYEYLDSVNISVEGKIVIVRYGAIFRGTKVMLAQMHGAVGVLIYSEPADDGYGFNHTRTVYPDGIWRPENSVQRGSALFLPICPGNPIASRVKELCINEDTPVNDTIPSIPVQPISYADASPILAAISELSPNTVAPESWQGALPFKYSIGPAPTLEVNLALEMNFTETPIWNVFASLAGHGPEADQLVIIGNHRDAWVFGSGDPVSGTSVMLETARVLGELVQKHGWKPKRTLIIASWDAEEYGLIGSTQYVEDNAQMLSEKAIVYLNVDVAVTNPKFSAAATPSLRTLIHTVTEDIEYFNDTIADYWHGRIGALGSGSDYTAFIDRIGVASLDYGFNDGPYPIYHSNYDSYHWMQTFIDPDWYIHASAAKFLSLMAYRIADNDVLTYNYSDYSVAVDEYFSTLLDTVQTYGGTGNVNLTGLAASFRRFSDMANKVEETRMNILYTDAVSAQQLMGLEVGMNSLLVSIERQFLNEKGVWARPWFKHVLQAPGSYDGYGTQVIPSVMQLVMEKNWDKAQEQAEVVAEQMDKATQYMRDGLNNLDRTSSDGDGKKKWIIALSVLGAVFCLLLIVLAAMFAFYMLRRTSDTEKRELEPINPKAE